MGDCFWRVMVTISPVSHCGRSFATRWRSRACLPQRTFKRDRLNKNFYTALTGSATYTASGTAGFADGLQAWHNGEPIALVTAPSAEDQGYNQNYDWTAELEVSAGPQLLELRLYNPYSSQTIEKRYFTAKSAVLPEITVEYDGSGRIQRRDFSDGRSEVYTWDALGRLWAIEQRNSQNDGYNWRAAYDGIGRRLQTEYFQVLANVPQSDSGQSIYSVYDPQVEFLELGVKVGNAATEWKVFGNDLNGAYGGLHGIGGLLGLHSSDASAVERIVDDVYGHQQGVLNTASGALSWTTQSYGAYGAFGAELPTLESGSTLASTRGWRGYRTDPTGFIYMGARYYNATEGRFISPDPFGHAASMDLYSFANGDPINFVDPTGRGAVQGNPSETVNPLGQIIPINPANQFDRYATTGGYGTGGTYVNGISQLGFWTIGLPAATASYVLSGSWAWSSLSLTTRVLVGGSFTGGQIIAKPGDPLNYYGTGVLDDGFKATNKLGSVKTPYGLASQADDAASLAARSQVDGGATLYRTGTMGKSAAGEAQFWTLESPLSPGYAQRYGIPAENVLRADFIETATLRPGTSFITRPAPGIGGNVGGGIEAVFPSGGVNLNTFSTGPF